MLIGTQFQADQLYLYPLALGRISILASIVGVFCARIEPGGSINDFTPSMVIAVVLRDRVHPVTMAFDDGRFTFTETASRVGLVVTFLLVAITEY